MSTRKRTSNRCGRSGRFSGSTMRLFDRIEQGLGKSYLEQQKTARNLAKNMFRKEANDG